MKTGKMFRKIFCIVCALLLCVVSLMGCGGGKKGSDGIKDISDRDIYDGGEGMDDGQLNIFRWNFGGVNTARKNKTAIYNRLKEVAGMDIYADNASAGDWETQLSIMFGTQTLPDIFVSKGPETPDAYRKMIREGVLVPVSDYVDENTFPNIYNQLQKYKFLETNLSYSEGKQWSIPVNWTLEHTLYIRTDWVDNLNETTKLTACLTDELGRAPTAQELVDLKYKQPDDLLEFYRLARAFTLYDPDGNGINDTFGYTDALGENMFADCWIFEAFDAGYQRMVKVGDRYESSWANENDKKALAFFNSLINAQYPTTVLGKTYTRDDKITKGYIDNTAFENDTGVKQDHFANGKCGMMEAHAWYNTIIQSFINANTKPGGGKYSIAEASAKIDMFAPPKGENGTRGINGNPGFWTVTCLNNGMSDDELEAALNLIDFLLSEEGDALLNKGIEGVHYEANNQYNKNEIGYYQSLMGVDPSSGFNVTVPMEDTCAEIASVTNWSSGYYSPYASNADKIIATMERAKGYLRYSEYPFVQPQSYVNKWMTLQDMAQEEFYKLAKNATYFGKPSKEIPKTYAELVNVTNINSAWNAYMDKFNNAGGNQMVKDYNDAIAKGGVTRVDLPVYQG